jgi:hypothetical protein
VKDAEYELQKERVRALSDKWLGPLGLKRWREIEIGYSDTLKEGSPDCAADASVQWEYLQASLTFYLPKCSTLNDADLEYCFVHECMHVLVKEMRWQDDNKPDNIRHEERVCTTIAQAFLWVRDYAKDGNL